MRKHKTQIDITVVEPELEIKFDFDPDIISAIKSLPVRRWDKENKLWAVPTTFRKELEEVLKGKGQLNFKREGVVVPSCSLNPKLHPYQKEGVTRILTSRRVMLSFEMGLGKTPTFIEACRVAEVEKILVICPAMVRQHWADEFDKWWPDHPPLGAHTVGKEVPTTDIIISSYELCAYTCHIYFDAIVFDESHYVKNALAGRSKTVMGLVKISRPKFCVALTGTPITSEPVDIHNQINILRPGYLSTWHSFVKRYAIKRENIHTKWDYYGLQPEKAAELQSLLNPITYRVTKKEVSHLLPPFQVQALRLENQHRHADLYKQIESGDEAILDVLKKNASFKVKEAVALAEDASVNGERVAILCWHKSVARRVKAMLPPHHSMYVDGDMPTEKRSKYLKSAQEVGVKYLVATIASVNVGIDLTYFTTAICVEMHWSTSVMSQLAGRFSRLTGKNAARMLLLVLKGTVDEAISRVLLRRFADQNKMWEAGHSESTLIDALDERKSDEEYKQELLKAALEIEEDEYGL